MFYSENKKIMYTPVSPNFTNQKWDVRGSVLHGHVSMMYSINVLQLKSKLAAILNIQIKLSYN